MTDIYVAGIAMTVFGRHPERSLHVREIARLAGAPAGTMLKELEQLHAVGLLSRKRVGNQVQFAANRSHPVYGEVAALLRKTVGLADVLREALAPLAPRIQAAFVFGSMARGRPRLLHFSSNMASGSRLLASGPSSLSSQRELHSRLAVRLLTRVCYGSLRVCRVSITLSRGFSVAPTEIGASRFCTDRSNGCQSAQPRRRGETSLGGLEPAEQPQRQRHLRLGREQRVTGDEDQPQQVIAGPASRVALEFETVL